MRIPTFKTFVRRSCAAAAFALLGLAGPLLAADWPTRPVTIVVPAGAGGGSDGTARILAKYLKEELGQQFNVINLGQGGGVVGIQRIVSARPDGYTLGVLFNYAHYKEMGQADFTLDDFTPIGQYNFDPAGFQVRDDSPFTSIDQALDAIKADPSKYTIACAGGCGGSWPVAVATLLDRWGVEMTKVRMIPGQGAAAAMQDLAAGGVDFVPCSLPEADALLKTGKVRSLAVFGQERLPTFDSVPSLKEQTGLDLELGSFRGLVAPAGVPDELRAKLQAALEKVYQNPAWQEEMQARGFGLQWRDANAFTRYLQQHTQDVQALFAKMNLE
ncbi:tripartite tricarboxylate transporter substrate binding protein [Stutzerimonas azotifigens]|uniref:Tripartite tricarboxylate transporter substrate binding protein n=1 Tax=Stutzerimonas azotifigens TaxID=291995 RepID=A0ABR5Z454_9GAMM|nr:tripartite tricarboxylate transporter substrate binding protein [Stutzerimonas azotifigens]MBA1275009.1 tripartite tricarboxylate transporter substrate binding protein [Stutzerimonas azotifigens]